MHSYDGAMSVEYSFGVDSK